MKFQDLEYFSNEDAEAALLRNDPREIAHALIAISLSAPDLEWAQAVCLKHATHPHEGVRGNAVLGFGHLARRFGQLNRDQVKPLVQSALEDESAYVRGHAVSAADDLKFFLKWRF
jgi:hypothetical protein